jgi:hypothetical protein
MPILPLDHPEPSAATLGVMLYPDEADALKARAYAAQFLPVVRPAMTSRASRCPGCRRPPYRKSQRSSALRGIEARDAVERRTEVVLTAPQSTHRYVCSVTVEWAG